MQFVSFRLLFLATCLQASDWSVRLYRFGNEEPFVGSIAVLSGTVQQSPALNANSCSAVQEIPRLLLNRKFHDRAHNSTTARHSSLTSHSRAHNQPDSLSLIVN
jgi:hypothetical protein